MVTVTTPTPMLVVDNNILVENEQLKRRVAELEALVAQYETREFVYANKTYVQVVRGAQAGDLVSFEKSNSPLIKPGELYRLTFFNAKARIVLENGVVVNLHDPVVQRAVQGMKVFTLKGGETHGDN